MDADGIPRDRYDHVYVEVKRVLDEEESHPNKLLAAHERGYVRILISPETLREIAKPLERFRDRIRC